MVKIKRSQVRTFINIMPGGTADYALINEGVTSGKIEYNPKTSEETYIAEDNASIAVESYAPTLPIEASAVAGDEVFDFIDGLRIARATLADAETDIVNVWMYKTPAGSEYPAEKQAVSIQIDDFGGEGGESAKINYTINFNGNPVAGTFNVSTFAFTPS